MFTRAQLVQKDGCSQKIKTSMLLAFENAIKFKNHLQPADKVKTDIHKKKTIVLIRALRAYVYTCTARSKRRLFSKNKDKHVASV